MKGSRSDHPLCIDLLPGLCKIKCPHLKNEMHKVVGSGREVEAQKNTEEHGDEGGLAQIVTSRPFCLYIDIIDLRKSIISMVSRAVFCYGMTW